MTVAIELPTVDGGKQRISSSPAPRDLDGCEPGIVTLPGFGIHLEQRPAAGARDVQRLRHASDSSVDRGGLLRLVVRFLAGLPPFALLLAMDRPSPTLKRTSGTRSCT